MFENRSPYIIHVGEKKTQRTTTMEWSKKKKDALRIGTLLWRSSEKLRAFALQVLVRRRRAAGGLIRLLCSTVACSKSCGKVERSTQGCLCLINKDTERQICAHSHQVMSRKCDQVFTLHLLPIEHTAQQPQRKKKTPCTFTLPLIDDSVCCSVSGVCSDTSETVDKSIVACTAIYSLQTKAADVTCVLPNRSLDCTAISYIQKELT